MRTTPVDVWGGAGTMPSGAVIGFPIDNLILTAGSNIVTHGLGTKEIVFQARDTVTGEEVLLRVIEIDDNSCEVNVPLEYDSVNVRIIKAGIIPSNNC